MLLMTGGGAYPLRTCNEEKRILNLARLHVPTTRQTGPEPREALVFMDRISRQQKDVFRTRLDSVVTTPGSHGDQISTLALSVDRGDDIVVEMFRDVDDYY